MLGLIAVALTRPLRLAPIPLALLLALLHLSLAHARHEMLLAVIGPMLLARPLADALGAPGAATKLDRRLAGLVVAALVLAAVRAALPAPTLPALASVRAALAALPDSVRTPAGAERLRSWRLPDLGGRQALRGRPRGSVRRRIPQ